jgi:ATP-dependent Clp protease ATP-binding subunit ClpA
LEHGERDWAEAERMVTDTLRHTFKPEFLNRVDDIIMFRPLSREDLLEILDLQLQRVEKLLESRRLTLQVTPEVKELMVGEGFDPVYGARPLKRVIQRKIQNPLALALLEGKFGDGDTIRLTRKGESDALEFTQISTPEAARARVDN